MASRTDYGDYGYRDDRPASGGPLFSVWTPILAAILSLALAVVVVLTAK
ncbi:MAG TPA: hypothetical protein VIV40_34710 [Kofleriaceae bacterium]